MSKRTVPKDFEELLEAEPWLRPYFEAGDSDLEPARARFQIAGQAAKVRMAREGVTYFRRLEKDGLLTTALDPQGVRR